MKRVSVVPALVAVLLLVGWLMPAPPAHALAPWIIMAGIKLLDFGIQESTKQTRSEVGAMTVANLEFDGGIVAGTPTAGLAELVVPRVEGHEVILLVETQADVVPNVCSDFTEVQVGCFRFPDFTITAEMAADLAASRQGSDPRPQRCEREPERSLERSNLIQSGIDRMRRYEQPTSQSRRRQDDGVERDWVVPIDINELEFGQYIFRLDYYFKNGGARDSFAVFIHLFVTDLQTLQEGVNSPVIQQVLRMTGGIWTPIPVMGTTSIPVTTEMARQNGMEQAAVAAGIPPDGTVVTTQRVVGEVQYVPPPASALPSAPTIDDGILQNVRSVSGYAGDPKVSRVYRTDRQIGFVPLVVCLRSSDQQVTVNGQPQPTIRPGHPYVVVNTRAGMELQVQIDGRDFFRGIAPWDGLGLWLVVQ